MPAKDEYDRAGLAAHPPLFSPAYGSSRSRAPSQLPISIPQTLSELTGPIFGHDRLSPGDADLTRQHAGEPQGERILVKGRIMDEAGRPVPHSLVEIWQTNAAGRYRHERDQHPAPIDPNFSGAGRCVSDAEGRYEFTTIKPGAYPWRNQPNAWRPAQTNLSTFGPAFLSRLVTQIFPGDPLFAHDAIFNSIPIRGGHGWWHADLEATQANGRWAMSSTSCAVPPHRWT